MATLQTHAEPQQEQIQMAEVVIQQLRANPTNLCPPLRAAFQKPVTEGGAFKALTKYTGNRSSITIGPSVRDESSQELTRDLQDISSGFLDRLMK